MFIRHFGLFATVLFVATRAAATTPSIIVEHPPGLSPAMSSRALSDPLDRALVSGGPSVVDTRPVTLALVVRRQVRTVSRPRTVTHYRAPVRRVTTVRRAPTVRRTTFRQAPVIRRSSPRPVAHAPIGSVRRPVALHSNAPARTVSRPPRPVTSSHPTHIGSPVHPSHVATTGRPASGPANTILAQPTGKTVSPPSLHSGASNPFAPARTTTSTAVPARTATLTNPATAAQPATPHPLSSASNPFKPATAKPATGAVKPATAGAKAAGPCNGLPVTSNGCTPAAAPPAPPPINVVIGNQPVAPTGGAPSSGNPKNVPTPCQDLTGPFGCRNAGQIPNMTGASSPQIGTLRQQLRQKLNTERLAARRAAYRQLDRLIDQARARDASKDFRQFVVNTLNQNGLPVPDDIFNDDGDGSADNPGSGLPAAANPVAPPAPAADADPQVQPPDPNASPTPKELPTFSTGLSPEEECNEIAYYYLANDFEHLASYVPTGHAIPERCMPTVQAAAALQEQRDQEHGDEQREIKATTREQEQLVNPGTPPGAEDKSLFERVHQEHNRQQTIGNVGKHP
jgi:hypothetical protein